MVELDVVKQHCRIDTDFTGDDALLTLYTGAAARCADAAYLAAG